MLSLGDLRRSNALNGVPPPEVVDAGVVSWGLLAFEAKISGAGEPLRSTKGDLGGTCGGSSKSSMKLAVSTFNKGFGVAPGLSIGDNGLPGTLSRSEEKGAVLCWTSPGEGPVTQAIMASPKGPALQFVPGALQDLSWPKTSYESFRSGGLPGIVARKDKPLF
jgi:hypothetical protein